MRYEVEFKMTTVVEASSAAEAKARATSYTQSLRERIDGAGDRLSFRCVARPAK